MQKIKHFAHRYQLKKIVIKKKTKSIVFSELKLREYLVRNKRILLSKLLFSVRSKTEYKRMAAIVV